MYSEFLRSSQCKCRVKEQHAGEIWGRGCPPRPLRLRWVTPSPGASGRRPININAREHTHFRTTPARHQRDTDQVNRIPWSMSWSTALNARLVIYYCRTKSAPCGIRSITTLRLIKPIPTSVKVRKRARSQKVTPNLKNAVGG